ncbi:MAG: hypothetical protein IKA36_06130, partial [Clostridia bacterium]|nr:hypothetical protein [Clostridia bacterium]
MAIFVDRNCIDESFIYESFEDMNDLNLQAYNEVYFGDSTIEPILDAFSKFRKTWVGKPFNLKINYDPNLLKFNRLIENKFGFYRFSLTIDPTMDLNAYMMNVEFMSDTDLSSVGKNLVVKDGHGFRYSKDSGISALACVFYGLLCDGRFSDREIIAVLLHEIGHTFTFAVLNRNGEMLTRAKAAFCRV